MNSAPSSPAEIYERGHREALAHAEAHGARSRLVGNLRGLTFAASVIGWGTFFVEGSPIGLWVGVGGLLAFFALVSRHDRIVESEDHARRLALVNEHSLLRAEGRFHSLPETGAAFAPREHPYAGDLDVFGPGSLYQRLSVAHTHYGQSALVEWLGSFASPDEITRRQAAVRELAAALTFRQELEASSLALIERRRKDRVELAPSPDPSPLLEWIEEAPALLGRPLLIVASWVLPLLTCGGIANHAWGTGRALGWILPLLAQLALLAATAQATSRAFGAVSATEGAFLRYGQLLELIEKLEVSAPWLLERKQRLAASESGQPASRSMRRFRGLVGWFDLRHNGMVYPFIDALLLWDIHCTVALERWKRDVGRRARGWFSVIGEIEALSSLAGLAHDEPDAVFPTIAEPTARLEAEGLGHALLPRTRRVTNTIAPLAPGEALLVTGSNMSGKSTFLRSLGTGAVLAFAGAPVTAERFVIPRCSLGTSIRVSDSLSSGTSHFYAEVKKLAHVVELSRGELPVFFLLDEVLHGTNSRERQIGARSVLAQLLESRAFGVVTTHDEGLCALPAPLMDHVRQHHFRESVQEGEMTFDYQLREGPVKSGNALRLMRQVGLDVPLDG